VSLELAKTWEAVGREYKFLGRSVRAHIKVKDLKVKMSEKKSAGGVQTGNRRTSKIG
jgi:hypothetical protein